MSNGWDGVDSFREHFYGNRNRDEAYYDLAQVCLNGHVTNEMARTQPEHNKRFCGTCGQSTVTTCQKCQAEIKGHYHVPGVVNFITIEPPKYCESCGQPFPWTERKLTAVKDLIGQSDLSNVEQQELADSIVDIIQESPNKEAAALRFKKLSSKAGTAIGNALKSVLTDVVSETVKKLIWPQS